MRGEQMVGDLLIPLAREGYYVFHDFPRIGWNIDHIVIGETGVFVVETKARRNLIGTGADSDHHIDFDGAALHFVKRNIHERKPIHQAARAAQDLEKFISERACVSVSVTPMLTFPGWMVNRNRDSDVLVVNPKELRKFIMGSRRGRLSADVISRIVAVIDRECRDVEW